MKRAYEIRIKTDRSLDADTFARPFLAAWLQFDDRLRPERFGHGEPIRKSIESEGFEKLMEEWRKPPALMFKRVSAPKFTASVKWRTEKGKDPRPYPWGITVWLDWKAKDALATTLFEFLISWFEPAFASITTSEDSYRKHFTKYPYYKNGKLIGTAEQFVGADVLDTLPGIYWLTYMTPKVIDEQLLVKLGDKILRRDERGGYLIRAYENSSAIGSEAAQTLENEIIGALGPEKFFDKNRWKPPTQEVSVPGSSVTH